ncbi:MAG: hypothetical protein KF720_20585 [Rubrivivax sp.]|nr:hypothetical protein [Rubrivivax sp.]
MPRVLQETDSLGAGFGTAWRLSRKVLKSVALAVVATAATVSAVSAETLLMPKRDARTTADVVVWGVHTQAAGTACTLNFGDGSAVQNCTGVDRSYIAYPHTYAIQGTYTVTLTVGSETATTTVQAFNPAAFPGGGAASFENRNLGINMAIQDGLRYLWTNQNNRAGGFPTSTTTFWNNSGFTYADTSLVVLAFENQGYRLTANVAPTGIYEKYIVRRGLNFVASQLLQQPLSVTPAGNNPCVVYVDCVGLTTGSDQGYSTALAILGFAGSGALAQINTEVAGYTNGKTYGEILQRLVNGLIWGQNDSGNGRGSWDYGFNSTRGDGSTLGWDTLGLLDARAAGATVPAWVIAEYTLGFNCTLNNDGSFDYVADCNAAASSNAGPQKAGIGLQGLFLIGETTGARVNAVRNNINSWWNGATGGIGSNDWGCGVPGIFYPNDSNKGCAYSMFNNFKGLKLQNIATLPGVTRPAGPGAIPANDWYADYEDWLVTNQSAPTTPAGGSWGPVMGFSCCANGDALETAIAELILAPVALVPPDPGLFSTVGLSPASATNPVGTDHTVTAFTQSTNGAPVPGVSINFKVLTGPNAGKTGSGTTGADGKTTFTYHDDGGAGTDTIQAFIGTTLSSNQVTKTWADAVVVCDVNGDGKVTQADLTLIRGKNGRNASGANDPYDPNKDGKINVADVRYCQLRLTPP